MVFLAPVPCHVRNLPATWLLRTWCSPLLCVLLARVLLSWCSCSCLTFSFRSVASAIWTLKCNSTSVSFYPPLVNLPFLLRRRLLRAELCSLITLSAPKKPLKTISKKTWLIISFVTSIINFFVAQKHRAAPGFPQTAHFDRLGVSPRLRSLFCRCLQVHQVILIYQLGFLTFADLTSLYLVAICPISLLF